MRAADCSHYRWARSISLTIRPSGDRGGGLGVDTEYGPPDSCDSDVVRFTLAGVNADGDAVNSYLGEVRLTQ